ncbi:MAG: hypothetical protein V5A29_18535 [Haloarculaceae archaeon]
MKRTWSVSILLVVLVTVAGCTGGVPDAPTGGNGGSGSSGGGGSSGDSGGDLDVADSERVLREAGSFTSSWAFTTVDTDGVESRMSNRFAVDLAANRTSESLSMVGEEGVSYERFTADGTSYTRYGDGAEVFYQVMPVEDDPLADALSRGTGFGYGDVEEARRVGTESFDGVTVDRYEYTDRTLWRQYGATTFGTEENVTVTEFTVFVLVDGEGLARSTGWTLVGETDAGGTVTGEWRFDLTGVGSTTVTDPDWLVEARGAGSATG